MKVGLISYPIVYQSPGGLAVQIEETLNALIALGTDACYIDTRSQRFHDFDLVHVFGAVASNDRIIQECGGHGVATVLSTVLHPPFSRWQRLREEFALHLTGRVTNWASSTTYGTIRRALDAADRIIALGNDEKQMLVAGYRQDAAKITCIPNGVASRFFAAEDGPFRQRYDLKRPIVLEVASVDRRKNQLALSKAISDIDCSLVLVGGCLESERPYLAEVLAASQGKAHFLGPIPYEDPLLPAVYAAADVFVLPSLSEVMPISVLEALASGTPTIVTKHNSHDMTPIAGMLEEVAPDDVGQIRSAIARMLSAPPDRAAVQQIAQAYSWNGVAEQILRLYDGVLSERRA